MKTFLLSILALGLPLAPARAAEPKDSQSGAEPDFKPELVSVDFTSRRVRPGASAGVTYRFRNDGTKPARGERRVFVHLESPKKSCNDIILNLDHTPLTPTTAWQPGEVVSDGPHSFTVPADFEGEYHVHVGIHCPTEEGGTRLLDRYAGTLVVSRDAPSEKEIGPKPLAAAEAEARRQLLAGRIANAVTLESDTLLFRLDRDSLAFDLIDRASGVRWTSSLLGEPFARVHLARENSEKSVSVAKARVEAAPDAITLVSPLSIEDEPAGVTVRFRISLVNDPGGLRFAYDAAETGDWKVSRVDLFEGAFPATDADDGLVVLPRGIGEAMPLNEILPQSLALQTYSHLHMAMCGLVKQGSGLLLAWPETETALRLKADWPKGETVPGARMAGVGLELSGRSKEFTVHPVGLGGYVEIARAYRAVAKTNGWFMNWAEKRRKWPRTDEMFGAADFKPFVFTRTLPGGRYGQKEEKTSLGYTFDEVAECARHWRNDLEIDKAMVVLAGWIHRGYDNQHPDVLPACPECGGNEALARAGEQIKSLGYTFGLHDNYQDMYPDAPSWNEADLNKDAEGRARKGGWWAGGQAYQVCAIKQVELAARPESNLPRIAKLFGPTIYFIDTTFAWGLVTCEDPAHPMTRYDDMVWKSKLCDLAKEHFGLFGSEKGREWAVPHADYLEGMLSDKTRADGSGRVIPLFPLVYSDCVNLYTHQGDRIGPGDAKKTIDHILYGEMPIYHFGRHLYWKTDIAEAIPMQPLPPVVKPAGDSEIEITYRWKVLAPVTKDLRCFVHFTHPDSSHAEKIAFQDDHRFENSTTSWQPGTTVEIGPRRVKAPPQYADGSRILIGLSDEHDRKTLSNAQGDDGRYDLGVISLTTPDAVFVPTENTGSDPDCFSRADRGWATDLCPTDRLIKNTYEVLSPLNRITAETPMTDHAFLTADHRVERTAFGDMEVVVNYGPEPYAHGGTVLPAFGFVVTSPGFVAFHASRHEGIDYDPTALFSIRSLDGRPIDGSGKVRIFHGFGPAKVRVGGKDFEVEREQVVTVK